MATKSESSADARGFIIVRHAHTDDIGRHFYPGAVLLTDGAFTTTRNVAPGNRHGFKPMLFATRGGARNYRVKHGYNTRAYGVAEWPAELERAESIYGPSSSSKE